MIPESQKITLTFLADESSNLLNTLVAKFNADISELNFARYERSGNEITYSHPTIPESKISIDELTNEQCNKLIQTMSAHVVQLMLKVDEMSVEQSRVARITSQLSFNIHSALQHQHSINGC